MNLVIHRYATITAIRTVHEKLLKSVTGLSHHINFLHKYI